MEKFIKDFAGQLLDEQEDLTADTNFRDLEDWDSLTAMAVIAMIQDEYGVKINDIDFKKQRTIGDLYQYIQDHQ